MHENFNFPAVRRKGKEVRRKGTRIPQRRALPGSIAEKGRGEDGEKREGRQSLLKGLRDEGVRERCKMRLFNSSLYSDSLSCSNSLFLLYFFFFLYPGELIGLLNCKKRSVG